MEPAGTSCLGLYFGVFLTAEKLFLLRRLEALPGWVSHAYCLIFVAVSWVIFAFDSMADVCTYVKSMFGWEAADG